MCKTAHVFTLCCRFGPSTSPRLHYQLQHSIVKTRPSTSLYGMNTMIIAAMVTINYRQVPCPIQHDVIILNKDHDNSHHSQINCELKRYDTASRCCVDNKVILVLCMECYYSDGCFGKIQTLFAPICGG